MNPDPPDPPRTHTLAWFALGLLAFTWMLATGVWVRAGVLRPPQSIEDWGFGLAAWTFVVGPHLLFAVAAWNQRYGGPNLIVCLGYGAVSAVGSLLLVAVTLTFDPEALLAFGMC